MKIRPLLPTELLKVKKKIVSFIKSYGDSRITHRGIRWFQQLNEKSFASGTLLAVALDQQQLIGFILFHDYGREESFIVVHPDYRKQGVGEALLKYALEHLPKVYTRVASDNLPSLKLCFSCGLQAFHLFHGPTRKPTFWLGGGDYNPADILDNLKKDAVLP